MEMLCALLYIFYFFLIFIYVFLAGPPGVCVDDNGNERKVSTVCLIQH